MLGSLIGEGDELSSIKSVNTINKEIERLNNQYDAMVKSSEAFMAFMFNPYLFECYSEYHTLLTNFSNHLITKSPYLPNEPIPEAQFSPETPTNLGELAGLMKNNEMSLIKALIIFLFPVPIYFLAFMKLVPWLVPVLGSVASICLFFSPEIIKWYLEYSKPKEEEDDLDTTNPSEWISKELQVMSDQYDAIRILIVGQDTKSERLAESYLKREPASFRRLEQEKEVFPNECLSVVRKIMVFCTNAYYEIKDDLISHLPVSNPIPQQMGPQ